MTSCTNPDTAPIPMQSPWSPNEEMPPWNGDYHLNITVQISYWPIYKWNRLHLGESLYKFIERVRTIFRQFCSEFFECDGEFVPHATDINGNPVYNIVLGSELLYSTSIFSTSV
jgi:hypothetical protein